MLMECNYLGVCSLSPSQGVAEAEFQTLTKKPEFLTTVLRQNLFFHPCGFVLVLVLVCFFELY